MGTDLPRRQGICSPGGQTNVPEGVTFMGSGATLSPKIFIKVGIRGLITPWETAGFDHCCH